MKFPYWPKEFNSAPIIALFAVSAALPAYLLRFRIGPVPMTGLEVVELAAIIYLIAASIKTKRPFGERIASLLAWIRKNPLFAAGSALVLIATIIGIAIAPDKRAALGVAKAYFWEPMILAWAVIAAKPERDQAYRACLAGFAASAIFVIIGGLVQYAFPSLITEPWTAERRITSIFDYPNAAALYLAPLAPLSLLLPIGFVTTLAIFAVILMAKSAGGLAAASFALLFVGAAKKKTRFVAIAAAALMALIVAFAPQAEGLRQQILMKDWSGRVHRIGWDESLAMLKDHPVLGAGLSGFPSAVAPYHTAQGVEIFQYPHNIVLATWSELGLLGLAGFVILLAWYFSRTYKQRAIRYAPFMAAAMVAILAHGLVDVPYFKNDLAMMFWLFAVLVAL